MGGIGVKKALRRLHRFESDPSHQLQLLVGVCPLKASRAVSSGSPFRTSQSDGNGYPVKLRQAHEARPLFGGLGADRNRGAADSQGGVAELKNNGASSDAPKISNDREGGECDGRK